MIVIMPETLKIKKHLMICFYDVKWFSCLEFKKHVVSLSTIEAEFITTAACAAQSIWMICILDRLGIKQNKCIIFCDNSSTITHSKNPVIHVRFHFLWELTNQGEVELVHCGTKDQLAYIMTKALKLEVIVKLIERLGMCSIEGINLLYFSSKIVQFKGGLVGIMSLCVEHVISC